jgi:cell division protease FtsH
MSIPVPSFIAESDAYKKARRSLKHYRLRRRRANATRKKATGRKVTLLLSVILIGLFASFFLTQDYVHTIDTEGENIRLDQLIALAKEKRVVSSEFRDQDHQIVGLFSTEPIVEEEEPKKPKNDDAKGKDGPKNQGAAGAAEVEEDPKDKRKNDKPKKEVEEPEPSVAPIGSGRFYLTVPQTDFASGALLDSLIAAGAEVTVDPQSEKAVARAVSTYLLPLLILATFFGLLFSAGRGGGTGIGEVMTFGTIGKGKGKRSGQAITTFDDVAGADEAVAELREVVDYLRDPERYEEIGAVPPKGVLLFGPPGCGKTLLSRAVAGEADVPFFSVAGAEFVESLVGVGAARVRDLFQRVRAVAPAIVFIDELDAAGRRRGHGGGSGGSDEREQTLNQLLVEMDGFEVSAGIVVIGATNRPDILDPALLRPGRFDRHITVDQPDAHGRQLILELHARGKPIAGVVDFEYLARRTPGFSGADLANVINESALLSLRERKSEITMDELHEAVQRVLHGPKRKGRVLLPEERERAAYHESGHVIVAAACGRADEVHRVSILARGRGLGLTGIQRDSDRTLFTRSQIYSQLVTAMGGLASEELIYGEPSTGAERDLEEATELARDMVGRYGFSPAIGRVRLLSSDAEQFLTNDSGISELSAGTHEAMDEEVRRLLEAAEQEASRLIEQNRAVLEAMAAKLQDVETLEGTELLRALKDVEAEDPEQLRTPFGRMTGNGAISSHKTETTKSR